MPRSALPPGTWESCGVQHNHALCQLDIETPSNLPCPLSWGSQCIYSSKPYFIPVATKHNSINAGSKCMNTTILFYYYYFYFIPHIADEPCFLMSLRVQDEHSLSVTVSGICWEVWRVCPRIQGKGTTAPEITLSSTSIHCSR